MKKKIILTGIVVVVASLVLFVNDYKTNYVYSNSAGIVGETGSPADGGKTCDQSGCHNSYPLRTKTGWITSNIPVTGYVAGTQYLITCTATCNGRSKFGFNAGASAGTITSSDSQTQTASNEVTHKSTSNTGTNGRSWNFNWTAPTSGSSVTFYAAFNCANGDGTQAGDSIFKCTLTVNESTAGIAEFAQNDASVKLFPNPVSDHLNIQYNDAQDELVSISLYSIDGKKIMDIVSGYQQAGIHNQQISLKGVVAQGLYFVRIVQGSKITMQKIVIQ